ncbi:DNA helicase [Tanacetum coccineum]
MGSSLSGNRMMFVETDKVNHAVETDMVKLVVKIESFGISAEELDKQTGSSDGLQPKQADLSCVHALNEAHLHEIHVVPSKHEADQYSSKYFFGLVTPFSSIEGQMSGPFSTDSRIIRPCCLFIMYSSILLFQESYISFSNIGGRLSAPERIALSARVVIEKFYRWRWRTFEDDTFTVKELSRLIEEKSLHVDDDGQETLWNKLVPKKVNIFVWRALKGRLPVRLEFVSRDIDLDTVKGICFVSALNIRLAASLLVSFMFGCRFVLLWNDIFGLLVLERLSPVSICLWMLLSIYGHLA